MVRERKPITVVWSRKDGEIREGSFDNLQDAELFWQVLGPQHEQGDVLRARLWDTRVAQGRVPLMQMPEEWPARAA